jgi:pimeloyl-ACP methyl ester carboxylesterase
MQLELLSRTPAGPQRATRVLFVHGICLGAWVWEANFMAHLAERGFATYALSLRGHGRSEGRAQIRHWRLSHFAADLEWALERIGGPVVVVGHSMGGGVAQHFLYRGGKAAGLVLMASAPPHGLVRASLSMYTRNPPLWHELNKLRFAGLRHVDYDVIERGMMSRPQSPAERERLLDRLSEPAMYAGLELMGWRPVAPLPWLTPPVMVMGGEEDEFIPPVDVKLTGVYYGVRPVMLPDCGHAIMLEPAWERGASHLCEWLVETFETPKRA